MGVIQHTPSPKMTFRELMRVLKPGGDFVVDTYMYNPYKMYLNLQYIFWRPLFRLLGDKVGKYLIDLMAPRLFPVHGAITNIPFLNSIFWKLFPFDSKFNQIELSKDEELLWFIMSKYDGYLSKFIFPQTRKSLIKLAEDSKIKDYHVKRQSFGDAAPLVIIGKKQFYSDLRFSNKKSLNYFNHYNNKFL